MSRKKIRYVITAVIMFYIIVVACAFIMLKEDDSVLADKTMAEILFERDEAKNEKSPKAKSTEAKTEKPTETETVTEKPTETEPVTEKPTETETETEKPTETESVTEKPTETEEITEEVTEPETEESTEKITEQVEEPEHYYTFTTTNKSTILNMRNAPNKKGSIIAKLNPHTTGYVIEKGEKWTKLATKKKIGYCATQYLEFDEISKEEYEEMVESYGLQDEGEQNGTQ